MNWCKLVLLIKSYMLWKDWWLMDLESGGAKKDAPDAKPSLGGNKLHALPTGFSYHSTDTDRDYPLIHMHTNRQLRRGSLNVVSGKVY
jgi:hypothetical protein